MPGTPKLSGYTFGLAIPWFPWLQCHLFLLLAALLEECDQLVGQKKTCLPLSLQLLGLQGVCPRNLLSPQHVVQRLLTVGAEGVWLEEVGELQGQREECQEKKQLVGKKRCASCVSC